jgi:hypothetical protein
VGGDKDESIKAFGTTLRHNLGDLTPHRVSHHHKSLQIKSVHNGLNFIGHRIQVGALSTPNSWVDRPNCGYPKGFNMFGRSLKIRLFYGS